MVEQLQGIALKPEELQWLLTPANFRQCLLERIATAKHSIYLAALYLEDDEAGREVMDALLAAKAENPTLDIKVLVDFHRARRGLIGHKGDSGNYLMYRKVMENNPNAFGIYGVPVKAREFLGVLHLKGFIIDDAVIYSGASLNNVYLQYNARYRFDRYHLIDNAALAKSMRDMIDTHLIADPAVSLLTQPPAQEVLPEKIEVRTFKQRLGEARYEFDGVREGNRVTPLVGLGRKHNALNKAVIGTVESAKTSLFICTPYFNPPRVLVRALVEKLRQGVKIDIVVGDKTANDFYIPPERDFNTIGALPYLYEQSLRKFAKRQQWAIEAGLLNIHLWKDEDNSFHLKGISADNRLHLITGSNLNPRAWALDLENGLLVQDETGVWGESFLAEQTHIMAHTQRLYHYSQVDTLHHYPAPVKKIMGRINRLKADILLKRIL
ncbi:CDP-diacylglycerol--serine O-phosphatidyltransferase [Shewanella sp. JM162201]|uniref:CDP-diacylglycerol--serine O-phosphatidyltransferase n=1 Tax=Shewanella jiangmenensis TaxID=2837387 RepID=A0ABS5V6M6_9GAMM|nr:CDP-diacylglycerol--serine O-phosphatidyltransferase [Shewanella jiangmenensis]MBT1445481.1 CDP-diacylglycerol--serine O-phosphatidyltransferase [Shewanella jiangmenensis]